MTDAPPARTRSAGRRPAASKAARSAALSSRHVPGYAPSGSAPCGADAASRISARVQKQGYVSSRPRASSYRPTRSDWRTTGPSQSTPTARRSASCRSSTPGRTRPVSRSSTRIRKRPPDERAKSQASSAVRRFPRWRSPVGGGAKRPVIFPAGAKKLREYERKRDFQDPPEPGVQPPRHPASPPTADLPRFVIQEHSATRLHWDLRLEHDGVLLSWAIPNGIPQSPDENRKAVHTEDHPLEYLDFHGEIPKGNYGAGTMTIWDRGTYLPEKVEP